MNAFINTTDSRETSQEIMDAIYGMAGSESEAVRIWEAPTYEESLAIWERVTNNGLRSSTDFCWGESGDCWASIAGIGG